MQLALKKKILCEHQIKKQRCILLDIATKPLHKAQFTKLCCGWLLRCAKLCKTWPCTALHTDQLAMYTKASLESHCTHIYLCTTHLETLQPHAHTTTQPLCLLKMQNSPSLHNSFHCCNSLLFENEQSSSNFSFKGILAGWCSASMTLDKVSSSTAAAAQVSTS